MIKIQKFIPRIFLALFAAVLFTSNLTAYAGTDNSLSSNTLIAKNVSEQAPEIIWPSGPEIESMSGVVMDFETGTIAYEKSGKEAHYPASITKIMTALVALENSSLDEIVVFSANAVYNIEFGSSSIARDVDEELTMEQCLYGLLLESANECGNAIAEHVGGSTEAFVQMMNDKAEELGCVNTHFANPHGLHDSNHYTCAYDMALIARAAYANPTFAIITGSKNYIIPPTNKHEEETRLNNHHAMLNYYRTNEYIYEGCVGGKTGYTSDALGTLVTYAKRNGSTLICVVMCVPATGNYKDTITLFDYYFNNMQSVRVGDIGHDFNSALGSSVSSLLREDEIPFAVDENATIYVPVGADLGNIQAEFVAVPKNSGGIGSMRFTYGDRQVGTAGIIGREIEAYPFLNTGEDKYIKINLGKTILLTLLFIAVTLILIKVFMGASAGIAVAKRKRRENRDPHKNMRVIKRRRRNRRSR